MISALFFPKVSDQAGPSHLAASASLVFSGLRPSGSQVLSPLDSFLFAQGHSSHHPLQTPELPAHLSAALLSISLWSYLPYIHYRSSLNPRALGDLCMWAGLVVLGPPYSLALFLGLPHLVLGSPACFFLPHSPQSQPHCAFLPRFPSPFFSYFRNSFPHILQVSVQMFTQPKVLSNSFLKL